MTGPLPRPIREYESVRDWDRALREQWGGDPLGEEPEKLETLTRFCEFSGRDPDEWLAFCFLRKRDTGARFGSTQRRTASATDFPSRVTKAPFFPSTTKSSIPFVLQPNKGSPQAMASILTMAKASYKVGKTNASAA